MRPILSVRSAGKDNVAVNQDRAVRCVVGINAELVHHVVNPDDVGVLRAGFDGRGGRAVRVSLSDAPDRPPDLAEDVIALNDALEALERIDVRKARIVELRFFAGLSVAETATILDLSPQTVGREWTFVKAWLRRELKHR